MTEDHARNQLDALNARLGMLEAMSSAVDRRDEVFAVIADSETLREARTRLSELLDVDEANVQAILDLQLMRFTGEMRTRLFDERDQLRSEFP